MTVDEINLQLNRVCIGKRVIQCRYVPHSPNKPMHWAQKSKWKQAWEEEVYWAWMQYPESREISHTFPWEKAEVTITLFMTHLMDKDNLYASCKGVLDGIKDLGILIDDSPEHVELKVKQEKVTKRKAQGVQINIKPQEYEIFHSKR